MPPSWRRKRHSFKILRSSWRMQAPMQSSSVMRYALHGHQRTLSQRLQNWRVTSAHSKTSVCSLSLSLSLSLSAWVFCNCVSSITYYTLRRQNQLEIRQNYVAAVEKYELTVEEIRTEERTRKVIVFFCFSSFSLLHSFPSSPFCWQVSSAETPPSPLLSHLLQELGSSLEQRKLNYHELQQRIAQRCVLYFNNYIRRRGYDGALNFDLQNKKLEIIVSR